MEANTPIQSIAKMQATIANCQVMMQAPNEVRQKYFDKVYAFNIIEMKTLTWRKKWSKQSCVQKEYKEFEVENNDTSIYNTLTQDEEDSAHHANTDVPSQGCVSCWL